MNLVSRLALCALAAIVVSLCFYMDGVFTNADKPHAAMSSFKPNGSSVTVDKMFVVDDCTVYRFDDSGKERYFARCHNSSVTPISGNQ